MDVPRAARATRRHARLQGPPAADADAGRRPRARDDRACLPRGSRDELRGALGRRRRRSDPAQLTAPAVSPGPRGYDREQVALEFLRRFDEDTLARREAVAPPERLHPLLGSQSGGDRRLDLKALVAVEDVVLEDEIDPAVLTYIDQPVVVAPPHVGALDIGRLLLDARGHLDVATGR